MVKKIPHKNNNGWLQGQNLDYTHRTATDAVCAF